MSSGATVELVPPARGLPDLVFTANAAVVLDRQVLLARFRHAERQREQGHFEAVFRSLQARGLVDCVRKLPENLVLEGAGDCVWDATRGLFFMGYGARSDAAARRRSRTCSAARSSPSSLRTSASTTWIPRSLPPRGEVMYLPEAFTARGRGIIRERVASNERFEIGLDDGCRLAANAVCLGNTLIMSGCSEPLRAALAERGYEVVTTPLPSFLRSGGSAFCLTLRLDRSSLPAANVIVEQAAVA